ncbi:MAG: NAD(P)/FAD-dependent oxidoreductase [Anaerolineales bacterium]|nr:NAD(P)/FAD-dependent oxidoreductase [Anaerolineales bacterium]
MYDLIVVGGGPAGLTATIYALRKRLDVLLVTKNLGGKTNWRMALPGVEEDEYYKVIRGLDTVNKFKQELEYLDFARLVEAAEKITQKGDHFIVQTKEGSELETKAVIIASGTKQQLLEIPGEKKYMMRGLCYSALSYAPLFIDKTTTVIGDGYLALRSAAELATVATQVNLVGPTGDSMKSPLGKKLQAADNVTLYEGYKVTEVLGNEFAEKLVVESPDGEKTEIAAEGTFVEMGLAPNSQMAADLVDLDENGRIIIDCGAKTSAPGIFAAGDVTTIEAEQVLVAVGEGAKAALSAYEYLLKL